MLDPRGSIRGPASGGSPRAWRVRATTSSSPATTRRAGVPPSTRAAWSTPQRAQRAARV